MVREIRSGNVEGNWQAMAYLNYLAYGSNLHFSRMQRRVPSARTLGRVALEGWRLCFHKRGADGSGKCNVIHTREPADCVHGVVYRIAAREKSLLDRVEGAGRGYEVRRLRLLRHADVFLYVAASSHIDECLQPFTWYKAYVVEGARFHGLPSGYIDALEAAEAVSDPDAGRRRDNVRLLWHLSR
jgi:gamma-glutamylcyclotransferase